MSPITIDYDHPDYNETVMRFWLQDLAARLLPGERVAVCLRWRAPRLPNDSRPLSSANTVDIHYSQKRKKATYRRLILCNRLWHCPVCAQRISEQRRQELTLASVGSGLFCVMATLTMQHKKSDPLASMVKAIVETYRQLKSGRAWQDVKAEYGVVGDVRALEVTYGDNGWHVHIHALIFLQSKLSNHAQETLEMTLKRRFLAILAHSGYNASWGHGLWLTSENEYIREYVAKFGRLPRARIDGNLWTIYHEITKSNVKKTRSDNGLTPWGLLIAYGLGDKHAAKLFIEYAKVFKGFHQLQWSRGLKDVIEIKDIKDDEIEDIPEAEYFASLSPDMWEQVVAMHKRAEVLQAVEKIEGNYKEFRVALAQLLDW